MYDNPDSEVDERTGLELAVVGSAIAFPEKFKELADILEPSMFEHNPARVLWGVISKRIPAGEPVDHMALGKVLGTDVRRIGGPGVFARFAQHAVPGSEWHASQLRETALRAAALQELDSIRLGFAASEDLGAAIEAAAKRVERVKERINSHGIATRQKRRIVLTPASQIQMRRTRWLWDTTPVGAPPTSHGRIPMNSLTIGAGKAGVGKSQFCAWLTARVTTGTLPGELAGKPRCVMYAATEDSWSQTIAPRMVAAGADMDRVFRIDVEDDGASSAQLTLPVDTALLGATAEEYGVALLIADPLLSFLDSGVNDYRQREVRAALEPLIAAADRHGFSIFGLAHFTKHGDPDPLQRISGSGGFGQVIRCLVAFAKVEDEESDYDFVLSIEKNNLGRLGLPGFKYSIVGAPVDTGLDGISQTSRFVLGDETSSSVSDAMKAETQPAEHGVSECEAWLKAFLVDAGGSAERKDILKAGKAAEFSESALERAKRNLKAKSVRTGFGKDMRALWSLPEAVVEGRSDG